jgi:hypothetical protein
MISIYDGCQCVGFELARGRAYSVKFWFRHFETVKAVWSNG